MALLDAQITALAAEGLSPYEIEERLGIPHYTVHAAHHAALMAGYAQEKPSETVEKNEQRKKKTYYEEHREECLRRMREYQKKNRKKISAYQLARYHKKKAERDKLKAESEEYRRQALGQLKRKETNDE